MKRQVSTGYVFMPASSRLDLSGVPGLTKGGLLAVLDVTTGGIVYAVASPGLGASFSGLVLSLAAPMTGMAPGDTLAVLFDDGAAAAQDSTLQVIAAAVAAGRVQTADANGAAFSTAVLMTAGTATAAGRSVGVVCTTAGTMTLPLAGGGTVALPVSLGWQTFPFAATAFAFGGAAAGTVYNLS